MGSKEGWPDVAYGLIVAGLAVNIDNTYSVSLHNTEMATKTPQTDFFFFRKKRILS